MQASVIAMLMNFRVAINILPPHTLADIAFALNPKTDEQSKSAEIDEHLNKRKSDCLDRRENAAYTRLHTWHCVSESGNSSMK
ncbi:MAG: hypothetical protein WA766_01125, partial [Candidatus Acidiferrales bacterium]